ncbi:UNVERIFIED_ORG: hypothetical protein [Escherichia phage CMSTMSU]
MKPIELESVHESEWAWIGINNPDIIVQNNSTIEALHQQALSVIYANK